MLELSRTYRVLCVFVGIGFIFFGVLGLKWSLGNIQRGRESLRWPQAAGEVVSANIEHKSSNPRTGEERYGLTVTYRYTVEGVAHRGSRYSFAGIASSGSMEECRKLAEDYSVGGRVQVYYSPSCPWESVLHPGPNRADYPFSGLMVALLAAGLALLWAFLARPFLRKDDKAAPRARSVREERWADMWAIWGICVFLGLLGTWGSWASWSSAPVIEVVAVLYALLLLWGLWCLFMKDRAIFFAAFVISALSVMAALCCESAMVFAHMADGDPWLAAMIAGAMSISGGIWAWFCRDGNAWRARFNEDTGVLYVGVLLERAQDDKARVGRRWNRRLIGLVGGLGATGALLGVAAARSLSVLDSCWHWLPAIGFAIGCACFSFLITLASIQLMMLWKWQRRCCRVAHVAGCPLWVSDPQDG